MSDDAFGFKAARVAKIAAIRPAAGAAHETSISISDIDAAGERHGFVSRAGEAAVANRRKSVGPTATLNIRCPVRVFNPFVAFCDNERLTYWEGIERLMQMANKLPR